MTVKEILIEYLKANGFDGLFYDPHDCVCGVDSLMPCETPTEHCTPGYRIPCDCGDPDHEFHISAEKPKKGQDDDRQ